jgi:hypothetical protein
VLWRKAIDGEIKPFERARRHIYTKADEKGDFSGLLLSVSAL